MRFNYTFQLLNLKNQEFHFQFQSHPNYPSALAFSDTLNFLGIKNVAYELEKEYWDELPEEFITVYKNDFALIRKNKTDFSVFSDKEEKISQEELFKNSENIVFLFEKEKAKEEKIGFNFSYFLYVVFGFAVLYSAIFQSWYSVVFTLLSVIGFYISLELFNKKFGKESAVLNNFCGSGAKNTAPENCTKIIDSDKIKILELKLSDFSLVYFSAILVLGLFLPNTENILKTVSLASVLVIAYSLFVQVFVEKIFCKICLIIIAVLAGQIAISFLFFSNEISVKATILSFFTFLMCFFGLVFINNEIEQKEKYRKSDIKNLKFKRNYDLFKRELLEQPKMNFQQSEIFRLGNSDAKLHISLVSNPYCGYCKDAHKILEKLLKKYPEGISAQIRFNYFEKNTDKTQKNLISDFFNIYTQENPDKFLEAIDFWFENRDEKKLRGKYNPDFEEPDLSEIIKTAEENKESGFTFTPMFLINGYPFPDKYDREDIFYFIDDLLEDDDFVKK
ncbi:MAG: vitamin K epoxide reductase family protein [Bergeyella sp.]